MMTMRKIVTAAAIAVTLATGALTAPGGARAGGFDVALNISVTPVSSYGTHKKSGKTGRKHSRQRSHPCDWLKRKALQTGNRYWWTRYRDCRGW